MSDIYMLCDMVTPTPIFSFYFKNVTLLRDYMFDAFKKLLLDEFTYIYI